MCIYIDMIYLGIVTHNIFRTFRPELWPLISAQYLENYITYFHQILYMHLYLQDLALDCYTSFFAYLYQSYGPLFTQKICFLSLS